RILSLTPSPGPEKAPLKLCFWIASFIKMLTISGYFSKIKIKNKVVALSSQDMSKLLDLPRPVIDKIYEAKALIEIKEKALVAALSTRQLSNPFFEVKKSAFDSLLAQNPGRPLKMKFKVDALLKSDYISQNVVGYIEGKVEPDSFLVFSAHYDHLGSMGKSAYFPGANDNASGVSMLLELAQFYTQPENRPAYSMAFMAFGAEEVGLLGSKYYVEHPLFPLAQIKFLINMDLVGTGDEGATVVNGLVFKDKFSLLTRLNDQKKYLPEIKVRGFAANSDHFYFTESGVPSFFIYTLGGIKAYHDIYDRPETLPLTRYEGLFHLIQDFVKHLRQQRSQD
ncbi:MAG: M28 family peptidase, partial [Bacteroidia bacterium]|nr:M28 family peptidase [Bacteroidia bacterium]